MLLIQAAKKNLTHFTQEQLISELALLGEKPFRAKQIWNWIFARGVKSFSEMSNVSKEMREVLAANFSLNRPEISKDILSSDGTRKWLVRFTDCKEVEVVFIPEETRGTLCISSQVGCTLACKFCHTGTQTLVRNLEFHEIVAQILIAKDHLADWDKNNRKLTNIVFMGMGEPFFNYENVAKAVKVLNDVCRDSPSALSVSDLLGESHRSGWKRSRNVSVDKTPVGAYISCPLSGVLDKSH